MQILSSGASFKGIVVIKFAIQLAVVMAAFFSCQILANDDTPWVAPNVTESETWSGNGVGPAGTPEMLGSMWISSSTSYSRVECEPSSATYVDEDKALIVVSYHNGNEGDSCDTPSGTSFYGYRTVELEAVCTNINYPLSEDIDSDGEPDHCHKSQCTENMDIFTQPPHMTNLRVCVSDGQGEYCQYRAGSIQNNSGIGWVVFRSTGNTCGTDSEDLPHPDFTPSPDDELPDPNDPNNPPSDDGNPDCTPVAGTGLTVCSVDPNEVCINGSCPEACGTLNGDFVCIRDDDGSEVGIDEPQNDNSDNQNADDETTPGDEGTHSRLDGLLENTDGLEGLLGDLIDAVGETGSDGTGGENEGEECGPGEYWIAETCVKFDKNDQPVNEDLDYIQIDQDIEKAKSDTRIELDAISSALDSKFTLALTGGSYTANNKTIKGVQVDFGFARLDSLFNFSYFGAIIFLAFSIRALIVLAGGQ